MLRFTVCALVVLSAAILPAQERSERNPFTSPDDVAAGARLFRPLCSNCHLQDATGWPGFTPNLTGGLRRVSSDAELFDVLHHGIAGTDMPAFTLDERQTWQLVAFVRSLAVVRGEIPGDPATGSVLFRERECITCHQVGGEGGRRGSDLLAAAAVRSTDELRNAILDPTREVHPRSFRVRATTAEGRMIEGWRLNEDSFSLQILDEDERLVSLEKADLRTFEILRDSPMPSYRDRLNDEELDDIVAYLVSRVEGERR